MDEIEKLKEIKKFREKKTVNASDIKAMRAVINGEEDENEVEVTFAKLMDMIKETVLNKGRSVEIRSGLFVHPNGKAEISNRLDKAELKYSFLGSTLTVHW